MEQKNPDIESARKRPGMYVGPTDSRGLTNCICYLIEWLLEDLPGGHYPQIEVVLHEDLSCSIWFCGAELSVEDVPEFKAPAIEAFFSRFEFVNRLPAASRIMRHPYWGGAVVVNALCERFDVTLVSECQLHRIAFSKGAVIEPLTRLVISSGEAEAGLLIEFLPDFTIFKPNEEFDSWWLVQEFTAITSVFPGLSIELNDQRESSIFQGLRAFYYPEGITGYAQELNLKKTCFFPEPVVFTGERRVKSQGFEWEHHLGTMKVEVAFQFRLEETDKEQIRSLVNGWWTSEGGTHVEGMRFALVNRLRGLVRRIPEYRDLVVSAGDCLAGIVAVVSVEDPNPSWVGSLQNELSTPVAEGIVNQIVSEGFERLLRETPGLENRLIQKVVQSAVKNDGEYVGVIGNF